MRCTTPYRRAEVPTLLEDDTISLVGIVLYGYHGARPEERTLGQRFIVDVDLHTDLRVASRSDDLANTVNYSEVYQVVETIIGGEPVNLIETLAARSAEALLSHFSLVHKTRVRVAKPGVAIAGSVLREAAASVLRSRTSPNQTPELG